MLHEQAQYEANDNHFRQFWQRTQTLLQEELESKVEMAKRADRDLVKFSRKVRDETAELDEHYLQRIKELEETVSRETQLNDEFERKVKLTLGLAAELRMLAAQEKSTKQVSLCIKELHSVRKQMEAKRDIYTQKAAEVEQFRRELDEDEPSQRHTTTMQTTTHGTVGTYRSVQRQSAEKQK